MTAKDLAEKLLEHPDCEVRIWTGDGHRKPVASVGWNMAFADQVIIIAKVFGCESGRCGVRAGAIEETTREA